MSANEAEEPVNVEVVTYDVARWKPPDLPFPHSMDRFITVYRTPRGSEALKPCVATIRFFTDR